MNDVKEVELSYLPIRSNAEVIAKDFLMELEDGTLVSIVGMGGSGEGGDGDHTIINAQIANLNKKTDENKAKIEQVDAILIGVEDKVAANEDTLANQDDRITTLENEECDVLSVNGQTGSVTLDAGDVGAIGKSGSQRIQGSLTIVNPAKQLSLSGAGGKTWHHEVLDGNYNIVETDVAIRATYTPEYFGYAGEIRENGQRVYSPNNRPNARDVGAYPATGGILNGWLQMGTEENYTHSFEESGDFSVYRFDSPRGLNLYQGSAGNTGRVANVNLDTGLTVYSGGIHDGDHRVYSPANKPTAEDVGALGATGNQIIDGELTADKFVNPSDYLHTTVFGLPNLPQGGTAWMEFNSGNSWLSAKKGASQGQAEINMLGTLQENGQRVYSPNNPQDAYTKAEVDELLENIDVGAGGGVDCTPAINALSTRVEEVEVDVSSLKIANSGLSSGIEQATALANQARTVATQASSQVTSLGDDVSDHESRIVSLESNAGGSGGAVNSVNGMTGNVNLTWDNTQFVGRNAPAGTSQVMQGHLSVKENLSAGGEIKEQGQRVYSPNNPQDAYTKREVDDKYDVATAIGHNALSEVRSVEFAVERHDARIAALESNSGGAVSSGFSYDTAITTYGDKETVIVKTDIDAVQSEDKFISIDVSAVNAIAYTASMGQFNSVITKGYIRLHYIQSFDNWYGESSFTCDDTHPQAPAINVRTDPDDNKLCLFIEVVGKAGHFELTPNYSNIPDVSATNWSLGTKPPREYDSLTWVDVNLPASEGSVDSLKRDVGDLEDTVEEVQAIATNASNAVNNLDLSILQNTQGVAELRARVEALEALIAKVVNNDQG